MKSKLVYLPINLNSDTARSVLKVSRMDSKPVDKVVCEVLEEYFARHPVNIKVDVKKLKKAKEIEKNVREEIGRKFAFLRQSHYLSQRSLGELLGLDQKTISNIEAGKRRVDIVELVGFAQVLGVELSYFFDFLN